jgi:glutamate synthase (NADPH/NADH) small chain
MNKKGLVSVPASMLETILTGSDLRAKYDAIVLAVGATQWPRSYQFPGRDNKGIYQAMEFLPWGNKQALGEVSEPPINLAGKHVIILGGGDTGADRLGTSIRQGAASVTQLEIMPRPSDERPSSQPWPTYPMSLSSIRCARRSRAIACTQYSTRRIYRRWKWKSQSPQNC